MTPEGQCNKHILILGCKNYPAFSSMKVISGGMEVYVCELLRHLKEKYFFSVIAGYSHSDDDKITIINVPIFGGFALQPISLCLYSLFVAIWLLLSGRRIDLVNAQTPLSGLIAFSLKKLFRIPYVVSVHIFAADKDHVGKLSRLYGAIEKVVLRNADRVISAGYQLKRFLDERYGFADGHVMVINPGMDLPVDVTDDPGDVIQRVIKDRSYKLLFLGRLIEENGIMDLLEAVRLLRDKPLRLYIAGNGNLEQAIKDFIAREELHDRIEMLGIVRGSDKAHLIRNANLSIRTSYHEVFPVAYLESIAYGVPVIATPAGDTEYLAERSAAIQIVPMLDPQKVAEAIIVKMNEGPLAADVIEKCRNFIQSISWEKQAKLTDQLFMSVLT